jgi:S-adenosylmethionine:tRNA ribosyltransferase-isomerase
MFVSDLDYAYPSELVAVEPSRPSRVAFVRGREEPVEINLGGLLAMFQSGDVLVINQSRVIPARLFAREGVEILFLRPQSRQTWEVLFPAKDFIPGNTLSLPEGITVTLLEKGLPQVVAVSRELTRDYFDQYGEYAIPPYIQTARGERHNRPTDRTWYQSAWALFPGSVAAPTASLHFQPTDLDFLRIKGVTVASLILHVGAGTFLPIRGMNLEDHRMHSETVYIPGATVEAVRQARLCGKRVWALGTTVTRALESHAAGLLAPTEGGFAGETRLFIRPGYPFQNVDVLLTNFHQPKSTLLSLVAAFAGLEHVKKTYQWAIARRFRLFSYGDLSVWMRQ